MEQYCAALLNQEKSLEDLQRHLRTTEELFRESVKRKNQQLDLLQNEVRRLKTSVGVRDEAAALQIDAALNAQGAELRRVKEALAARDVEVDRLQKELGVLKIELSDEKARRSAEASVSADSHQAQHALRRSEDECETLRTQLAQAQEAAMRLQSASAEAEAALEARDIEIKELRSRQSADGYGGSELDQRELQLLRAKADEDERALRAEQEARQAAEAHVEQLEAGREEFEAELEELRAQVSSSQRSGGGQPVSSSYGGGGGAATVGAPPPAMAERPSATSMAERAAAARGGAPRAATAPAPAPAMASSGGAQPQVRSLVVSGDAVVGATLTAEASFTDAEASTSKYSWYRGTSTQPLAEGMKYTVTVDDLSHELVVGVTPVHPSGARGPPMRASPSHPIALPGNWHSALKEWVDMGQRTFNNVTEGDKERQVLFRKDKLKVLDKAGKRLAKSDNYKGVKVTLDPDSPTNFSLTLNPKKAPLKLSAPGDVRDLIALTLSGFADPASLDALPVVATSAASSLHLSAAGSVSTRGGDSPASSQTSEQPSLADVDETAAKPAGAKLGAALKKGGLVSKLSFPIKKKK